METTDRPRALRFRLAGQSLGRRSPKSELGAVAGAVAVQNTPPGSAGQALHARLTGLTPRGLQAEVETGRTLVQLWAMRGAPHLVPVEDAAVYTTGLLPDGEESCLHFIQGATDHLARFGLGATDAVEYTCEALPGVLDGRHLSKDELGAALAEKVGEHLPPRLRGAWTEPDGLGSNTYGQSVVRYALYVVSLHGVLCIASQPRGNARFALTEQWLGRRLPSWEAGRARAELVRRYLRCHGPSTSAEFATWSGTAPAFAAASWELVAGELTEVGYRDGSAWVLTEDLPTLREPPAAQGVRLLPPHDPLLATRDRAALVAGDRARRQVWRSQGNPGVVLADGEVVALWRPSKKGNTVTIGVEGFGPLDDEVREAITREAETLAPFRGARNARVTVTSPG
ncbi:winged helix DNA-binding domain-containing protein [Prauserella sp. PE36]|uniref:winged helix DNA-binding domain-containing protein n=1 Tax=Prauserella sp. PE36 TaxID=1504709 RepID=UPI000DE1FB39|nr:winged helix DNA-binding domain-containing protein [Prauserella sp. PE36]RBM23171.1 winged helix DNA-binding domain-containing protein [Prauserella sp. PE36]